MQWRPRLWPLLVLEATAVAVWQLMKERRELVSKDYNSYSPESLCGESLSFDDKMMDLKMKSWNFFHWLLAVVAPLYLHLHESLCSLRSWVSLTTQEAESSKNSILSLQGQFKADVKDKCALNGDFRVEKRCSFSLFFFFFCFRLTNKSIICSPTRKKMKERQRRIDVIMTENSRLGRCKSITHAHTISTRTKCSCSTRTAPRAHMHKHTSHGIPVGANCSQHKRGRCRNRISGVVKRTHQCSPPPPPPPLFQLSTSSPPYHCTSSSSLLSVYDRGWLYTMTSPPALHLCHFLLLAHPLSSLTWWASLSLSVSLSLLPSSLVCPVVTSQGSLRHAACLFCSSLLFQEQTSHTHTHAAFSLSLSSPSPLFPCSTCFPCF